MKWSGETEEQRMVREYEWHKRRAWFPVQMPEGTWVWLEHVERRVRRCEYREIGSDWEPKEPQHPFGPNAHLVLENNTRKMRHEHLTKTTGDS